MTWPTAKLGEVADVKIGPFGSLLHQHDYVDGGVPLVNPTHIIDGKIVTDSRHAIAPKKARELENYRLAEGDVVLGRRGEMGRCAVVHGADQGFLCGTGSLIIRSGKFLSPDYLRLLLSSADMVRTLERASLGTTMPNLNQTIVANLQLPLPTLAEQRRIAAILDQADKLRRVRERANAQFEEYELALFATMFGRGSARNSLAALGLGFTSGMNVVGSDSDVHPTNRVIKVSAISSGRFKPTEIKAMPSTYHPSDAHRIRRGDILFGRASGSLDLLGATAVVDIDCDHLFLPDKVWRLECTRPSLAVGDYLLGVLRSQEFRAYVRHHASGAAGVRNIGKAKVLAYPAPSPPLELQEQYVHRINDLRSRRAVSNTQSLLLEELFLSLQSRAFRGEL